MKTEYTPGPWEIRDRFPDGDFNAQIIAPGKLSDGSTAIIIDQIHFKPNARLIAAAPELLEALKDAYLVLYQGNSVDLDDAMRRSSKTDLFEQKLISAIKKATK